MNLKNSEEQVDHLNINQGAPKQQHELKCDACEFKCKSEITLRKHSNTKHSIEITHIDRDTSNNLRCVLCENKFETQNKFNIHLGGNLEEIRYLEVKYLLNGQEKIIVTHVITCKKITIILNCIWLNMSTKACQLIWKKLIIIKQKAEKRSKGVKANEF